MLLPSGLQAGSVSTAGSSVSRVKPLRGQIQQPDVQVAAAARERQRQARAIGRERRRAVDPEPRETSRRSPVRTR